MRIGVDATSWFNGRGYGRFARELLPALALAGPSHEFVLFVEASNAPKLQLAARNVRVRPVACSVAPSEAASADGYRSARDLLRFTAAVRQERPEVVFFPTVYSYFPLVWGSRAVVTIHDTIAERFPALTLPTRRARLFWNLKVRLAVHQASLVLTVSDYSARDIHGRLGVPRDRMRVMSEAPAEAYTVPVSPGEIVEAARVAGLPAAARWFTYVGGFSPHKRIDVLVRAHATLAAQSADPPRLILVGSLDTDVFLGCRTEILALAEQLGTTGLIHWPGFVPDARLRALHAGAIACVLPSECEGFGLPAVEAAACGTPVIATTESPLPQLLEGGGLFVRPGDELALHAALAQLAGDETWRLQAGGRARQRARALSWSTAARAALDAIEEAAG
jgi:alpha-1,3-rhamnosyl/mannosyltransferase